MKSFTIFSKLNEIPLGIPRSHRFQKSVLCCSCYHSKSKIVDLLVELTGCTTKLAEEAVKERKQFAQASEERIRNTHSVLQECGLPKLDIIKNLRVLSVHPATLKNQYMIFEEAGFKDRQISCYKLCHFYTCFHQPVTVLKEKGFIDKNTDVNNSYSKYLGFHQPIDLGSQSRISDNNSLSELHVKYMLFLMKKFFGDVWPDNKELNKRLRYKSLRLISRTFEILTGKFELSKEKVKKNLPILCVLPERLEEILKKVPLLADTNINEIVKMRPKILMNTAESLILIDSYLKEFGIKKECVLHAPEIYTLHPDNVYNRLKTLMEHPVFSQWVYHPSFIEILVHQNRCTEHLQQLQDANMNCLSIPLLKSHEDNLKRHIEHLDKCNQHDILKYLQLTLSVDKNVARSALKKHPYWLYISQFDIKETLNYLRQEGFSNEEIVSNIIIILYPRNVVQEKLSKIHSKSGLECCRNPENGELHRETILPLLLYEIEQPFHFSKEAIWGYKNKDSFLQKASSDVIHDNVN
ncbi:transcription termination factor 5, mitochondrial-like isoform X2 [Lycorma delicatula]